MRKILELSESVQEYAWHPDGNKIIYMTGNKTYRGDERVIILLVSGFMTLRRKQRQRLQRRDGISGARTFDKHIYFWNGEDTVRYNIDTKK